MNLPGQSLMSQAYETGVERARRETGQMNTLAAVSLFAVQAEPPRLFREHDLIQIIVREESTARSSQEIETGKSYDLEAAIEAWPNLQLDELLQLRLFAGRTTQLPRVDVTAEKGFEGEGEYEREDEVSMRITAEVIQVLPNGNLILEARTHIKMDAEESRVKVTGICRPDDVTPANTILSSQLHDLSIEKMHTGELKRANERGVIAKVFDAVFAF